MRRQSFTIISSLLIILFFNSCSKDAGSSATIEKLDKSGPFLALKLSYSQIKAMAERENPDITTEAQYTSGTAVIDGLKVETVFVFLEAGVGIPQPLILIKASADSWEDLDKNPLFGAVLTKESDTLYKLKAEIAPKEVISSIGNASLKVQGEYALISTDKSKLTVDTLLKCTAMSKLNSVSRKTELGSMACIVPDKIDFSLSDIKSEALKSNMIANQIIGTLDGILSSFKESFQSVDFLALSLIIDDKNIDCRTLQKFRKDDAGRRTFDVLNGKSNEMDFDLVSDLSSGINHKSLNKKFTYKNGILEGQLSWDKKDSKKVMSGFSKVLMGTMMTGKDPEPTVGKLKTVYGTEPAMVTDVQMMKTELPKLVQQAAYPDKMRENSDMQTVYFEEIPGFGFRGNSLEYELLECKDANGKTLKLKPNDKKYPQNLNSFIWVKFTEKHKKASPVTLKMKLKSEIRPLKGSVEFNANETGKVKKGKSFVARLDYVKRDAVKVSVKGDVDIRLIVYDKNNRVLEKKSVNGFVTYNKGNYLGEIAKVKVVVYGEKQAVNVTCNLNIKAIELPKEPTVLKRTRKGYDVSFIDDFKQSDFSNFKVERVTSNNGRNDELVIYTKGSPEVYSSWNLYALKDGKAENSTYDNGSHDGKTSFNLRKLKGYKSFLGYINFKAKTGVEHHILKTGNAKTITTKDKKTIKIKINKNQVTYSADKVKIIKMTAFNQNGLVLKQGHSNSTFKNNISEMTYSYWGNIDRVEFQTYQSEITNSLKFDLTENVDKEAAKKIWTKLDLHMEMVNILKSAYKTQKKLNVNFGDNISYLHYAGNGISKEVAQSDPLGAAMFKYSVKTYKGYNFTLAKGKVDYNGKEIPFKNARPRDAKLTVGGKQVDVKAYRSSWNMPYIIAVPVDTSMPTYFINSNSIYWSTLDKKISFYPQNANKWKRASLN